MNYFKTHGPKLRKLGYEIIPIRQGFKYPEGAAGEGWRSGEITSSRLNAWAKAYPGDTGVGIRCSQTPAIDIDIYDKEIAQKLLDWLKENVKGGIVERVGEAPKILIPFRYGDKGGKLFSTAYRDELSIDHRIEVLRDGQQFVAYHTHPDTNREYGYPSKLELIDVRQSDLPEITTDIITGLFDYLDEIAPDNWTKKTDRKDKSMLASDDPLENFKPQADITDEEAQQMLAELPGDDGDYDTWVTIGMGIHHQMPDEKGFELWDEWSMKSPKYDPQQMRLKWRSFGNNKSLTPVTFATVIKHHQQYAVKAEKKKLEGDKPVPLEADSLTRFLKRYAYMPEGNSVVDRKRPIDLAVMSIEAFRNLTANKRMEVKAPTAKDPDRTRLEPIHKFWLTHDDRITIEGTTYDPSKPDRIVRGNDSRLFMNLAHFPEWHKRASKLEGDQTWRLTTFTDHMAYLLPDPVQRRWFIQWLAFCVQRPGERCKVTPLHISIPHGTGRGWVVEVLERILGNWNVSKAKMRHLCGSGGDSQYDDYLHQSLLCCIEECKESDKRYTVSDLVRDQLTETRLNLNLKYGGKGTKDVFTNFFWMSNHADAVIIPAEDRRITVLGGPDFVQSGEYYDNLYAWRKSPDNIAVLWQTLNDMDLSSFEWKVAPASKERDKMINYNMTSTESVFNRWLELNKWDFVTGPTIREQLGEISDQEGVDELIQEKQIRKLLQHAATPVKRVRIDGRKSPVASWYFGKDDPENIDIEIIKDSILRSEKDGI